MSEHTEFLGSYIRLVGPVPVTPVPGAFRISPEVPPAVGTLPHCTPHDPEPPEGELPLTFWAWGRAVASRWYPTESWTAIRDLPLFAHPVRLAFHASFPTATPGWMRVDMGALGERSDQLWTLLQVFRSLPAGVPLLHGGEGRVGLLLGHHWVRIPDDLVRQLPPADEGASDEVYDLFGAFARDAFRRIALGDEAEAAAQLLESIPGIRGERPDSDL